MVGTKPGDGFYNLYREIDALEENTVIYNAEYIKIELDGVMYEIPMHIDKFKSFLKALSPEDGDKIDSFCGDIKTMMNTKMPSGAPTNPLELVKLLKESRGFLSVARKYLVIKVDDFVKTFHSQKIQSILSSLMLPEISMTGLIMMLGTRMSGNAGYPLGGALDVIKRIESKYRSLGGKINFNSRVDEIVVENGRAAAIRSNGVLHPADAVIAACDAYNTIKNMLGGKYQHPQLETMLESSALFPALALVSFGLNRRFDIPFSISYECPGGIKTSPDTALHAFSIRSFDFDPAAAPENCSSVMVSLTAPLDYWNGLRLNDIDEYKKQKKQLADAVADAVEQRIPGFKDAIEVVDVATPATYLRLANLYKASFEGFLPTPASLKTNIRKTFPGVKGLLICGQWTTAGGGICSAVSSGKEAANLALRAIKGNRKR
jgi:phytoene dehydrogenase-like protein